MTGGPWRGAGPELLVAAIAVAASALAGLAVAGWPGFALVTTVAAGLSVAVVRGLAPPAAEQAVRTAGTKPTTRPVSGYAQRRFVVTNGVADAGFYESELRPVLERLLAARLAERHGINVYTEPEAARKAFCATTADEALWRWIDPVRPAPASPDPASASRPGGSPAAAIPRRVLARLVDRLENL
jgi:hypothetical protein